MAAPPKGMVALRSGEEIGAGITGDRMIGGGITGA